MKIFAALLAVLLLAGCARVSHEPRAPLSAGEIAGAWESTAGGEGSAAMKLTADGRVEFTSMPSNALPDADDYDSSQTLHWQDIVSRTGEWNSGDGENGVGDQYVWVTFEGDDGGLTSTKIGFDRSGTQPRAYLWWGDLDHRQRLWFERTTS